MLVELLLLVSVSFSWRWIKHYIFATKKKVAAVTNCENIVKLLVCFCVRHRRRSFLVCVLHVVENITKKKKPPPKQRPTFRESALLLLLLLFGGRVRVCVADVRRASTFLQPSNYQKFHIRLSRGRVVPKIKATKWVFSCKLSAPVCIDLSNFFFVFLYSIHTYVNIIISIRNK